MSRRDKMMAELQAASRTEAVYGNCVAWAHDEIERLTLKLDAVTNQRDEARYSAKHQKWNYRNAKKRNKSMHEQLKKLGLLYEASQSRLRTALELASGPVFSSSPQDHMEALRQIRVLLTRDAEEQNTRPVQTQSDPIPATALSAPLQSGAQEQECCTCGQFVSVMSSDGEWCNNCYKRPPATEKQCSPAP